MMHDINFLLEEGRNKKKSLRGSKYNNNNNNNRKAGDEFVVCEYKHQLEMKD